MNKQLDLSLRIDDREAKFLDLVMECTLTHSGRAKTNNE